MFASHPRMKSANFIARLLPDKTWLAAWLIALLIPIFAVQVALTYPIEEHAFDAAAFHIWRGVIFSEARAQGAFYPRWVMPINGGLGGPLFNFYSPLSYYLMDALHTLGLPHTLAWRVLVALALIVGAAGMFALGKYLFIRIDCALMATACFTYSPYYLRDFFERGAPQGMAIALYPLLILMLLRLAENPTGLRFGMSALVWSAILLLHNLSALIISPLLIVIGVYCVLRYRVRVLIPLIAALTAGLLLAAFHILPFVIDSKHIQINAASQDPTVQPALNPVPLGDLLAPPTIYDTGLDNNTSGSGVGLLHLFILATSVPVGMVLWQTKRRAESVLVIALTLLALFLLWMQLDPASGLWRTLRLLDVLQFRVRLLNIFGLIAAICSGYFFLILPKNFKWAIPVLITLFIAIQIPSLYPQLQHRYTDFPNNPTIADAQAWALANNTPGMTLTTSKELMPIWREMEFFGEYEVKQIATSPLAEVPDKATILEPERGMDYLRFRIVAAAEFRAIVHVMYFPGWIGYVNGKPQSIDPITPTGYTQVVIPAGDSMVELRYEGTTSQHVGNIVSIVVFAAIILIMVVSSLTARNKDKIKKKVVQTSIDVSLPQPDASRAFRYSVISVCVLIAAVAVKIIWIDSSTTLFRTTSTCASLPLAHQQVSANFGDNIQLCGISFDQRTLHPGEAVEVTLYWQIHEKEALPSYSYVHFLGTSFNPATNNPLWGQQDKQNPGTLPTTLWIPGKLYRDHYTFKIPENTPPHEQANYQLQVGWTNPAGERLMPRIIAGDVALSEYESLILTKVQVR